MSEVFTQIFSLSGNILSSVVLILANKRIVVVDHFKFMTVLTGIHSNFSFVATCILLALGCLKYKGVSSYMSLLRIAAGAVFSIVFMNFNLATNSVGFYQISKLSCIPVTLILEKLLGRRQQMLTIRMILSLSAIICGMMLVAVNEVAINAIGCGWAFCAVITTSLAQIYFAPLQKELSLNPLQMMFHLSPLMTLGSIITMPMFENMHDLFRFEVKMDLVTDILISCVMALGSNLTNFLVLSWASPLTYQVIGHMKTICVLVSGVFLYDTIPSDRSICGMVVAMLGVIAYTEENRRQQLHNANNTGNTTTTTTSSQEIKANGSSSSHENNKTNGSGTHTHHPFSQSSLENKMIEPFIDIEKMPLVSGTGKDKGSDKDKGWDKKKGNGKERDAEMGSNTDDNP